jgi:hypothetical protein
MKHIKRMIAIFQIAFRISIANSYFFWLKSFDNTINNIKEIQEKYNVDIPIAAFIFDPRSEDIIYILNHLSEELWTWKIYHITLSPNSYSAKQVSEWIFDNEYRQFFQTIKDNDLKIIFRTMHEMNWWRYPRWSNPEEFKKARIHVRELSREIWLNQNNILFDFSVNHRDMPTKWTPSQNAALITCNQKNKYKTIEHKTFIKTWYKEETITKKVAISQSYREKITNKPIQYQTITEKKIVEYPIYNITTETVQNCYTFEDYYPWDKYTDIMWVTFYNRWKATYSRQRYSPNTIMNDTNRNTLKRLKSFNKPIFIDEVWTTAVWYSWAYSQANAQKSYENDYENKNNRLWQLKDFMNNNPEIFWLVYFNVDYTNWLTNWLIWEADRAIINLNNWKFYNWFYDLFYNQWEYKNLFSIFEYKEYETTNENISETDDEIQQNKKTKNISYSEKEKIAKNLIKKFWKESAIKKIESIIKISDDKYINDLLNDIKKIINSK